MSMLFDFIPILLFFIAFKLYGIYVATTVGIVTTALQVVLTRIFKKAFDKQQIVTLVVFVVFGGMTLYFHDPIFVKWKPTIVFWVFGLVFFGSQFIGKKPIIQRMMGSVIEEKTTLPSFVWTRLNLAWSAFFTFLGTVNIYIAYTYSTDTWVNFKVYGIMSLLIVFSFLQAIYLSRYMTTK